MTKRDFQMVADVLKAEGERIPPGDKMEHSRMAGLRLAFHDKFQANFPRFDGAKFLAAAQPDENAYMDYIDWLRLDNAFRSETTLPAWLAERRKLRAKV